MSLYWWLSSTKPATPLVRRICRYHSEADGAQSSKEFNRRFSGYIKAFSKTADDLKKLKSESCSAERKRLSHRIFSRPYSRLAAVLYAAWKSNRHDICAQLTFKQAIARSNTGRWDHKTDEKVSPRHKLKADSTVRPIWEFGPTDYARQCLLSWVIAAQVSPYEADYSLAAPRGYHGAARSIANGLELGYRYWAAADIKTAYSSVSKAHLRALCSLDERLIRYLAFPSLPYPGINTTEAKPPRSELPQGAAHSPLVLSALIDEYVRASALTNVMVIVFADNIAIGAKTIKEAQCAFFSLSTALQNGSCKLPGGLMLHQKKLCDGYGVPDGLTSSIVSDGKPVTMYPAVDFVGYRVRWDCFDKQPHFSPSATAWRRFWEDVCNAWTDTPVSTSEKSRAKIAIRRYRTWRGQFPLWKTHRRANDQFLLNLSIQYQRWEEGAKEFC